jgi:putative ABC transport system permease protein
MAPALSGSRTSLTAALGDGARGSALSSARISTLLALSEVALALVLLVGASLMAQSFVRLSHVDPGFTTANVIAAPIALPGARYRTPQDRIRLFDDLVQRLQAQGGVRAAGAVSHPPLMPGDNRMGLDIEGRPSQRGDERRVSMRIVSGDYFKAMEIPLERGRFFAPSDERKAVPLIRWFEQQPLPPSYGEPQAVPVAIINEAMARRFWPGEDPLGRRVRLLFSPWITIVGIVGDVKHLGLAADALPEIYLSNTQEPQSALTLVVRTTGDTGSAAAMVRAQVRALDPQLPLARIMPMEEVLSRSLGRPRFDAMLLGTFSALALLLAMIGIYGVTSYGVGQRTREIGIRAALGATYADVLWLVLGRTFALTLAGIGVGLVAAYALTGVLSTLLFSITPKDPVTFAAVALALIAVSAVASYVPARRALRIDPVQALRMD